MESDGEALLIDAGFSLRQMERRLDEVGGALQRVRGVLLTHEHADHIKGLSRLTKCYPVPVYMSEGTARVIRDGSAGCHIYSEFKCFPISRKFQLGCWTLCAFHTPHDAEEPVGFLVESEGIRIGIATDMGTMNEQVVSSLLGLHALILESNHDPQLLAVSAYPEYVKDRISGPQGHLANDQAARILERVSHRGLRAVTLAHLSETNNTPELATKSARSVIAPWGTKFEIAAQHDPKVLQLARK